MATAKELRRETSTTRRICAALDASGPMTQAQLADVTSRTLGSVCKCLESLIAGGYVRRASRAPGRQGLLTGMRPWLYARTDKALPDGREVQVVAELGAVIDAMCRHA